MSRQPARDPKRSSAIVRWLRLAVQAGVLASLLVAARAASAQQTIINVPSDALTPVGQHFVLHESQLLWNKGGYGTTNFYTYGLTDKVELAATSYNIDNEGSPDAALGLGFKSVLKLFEEASPDLETKLTFGHMLPISLRGQSPDVGYFTYGHVAVNVPGTDFRTLWGVAGGSRNLYGESTASVIAGLEYPLTEHLSFTGEWFSGKHNFSALIPGLTYHRERLILVGGIKMPNDFAREDWGLVLEAGWFFGGPAQSEEAPSHYGVRLPR